jgi:hypothetical protein
MPTYLSAYEDHQTAIIERGGSEAAIEAAVTEYNRPTPAKLSEWVKQAALACAYCGKPAVVDDATRPTDEVTCAEHRT